MDDSIHQRERSNISLIDNTAILEEEGSQGCLTPHVTVMVLDM